MSHRSVGRFHLSSHASGVAQARSALGFTCFGTRKQTRQDRSGFLNRKGVLECLRELGLRGWNAAEKRDIWQICRNAAAVDKVFGVSPAWLPVLIHMSEFRVSWQTQGVLGPTSAAFGQSESARDQMLDQFGPMLA